MTMRRPRPQSISACGPTRIKANTFRMRCAPPMWTKQHVASRHHSPWSRSSPVTAPSLCSTSVLPSVRYDQTGNPARSTITSPTKNQSRFTARRNGTTIKGGVSGRRRE